MERFDEYFFTIAKETGGIEGVLNSMFSFLQRRTDFFYECDPGDKMGFPPGQQASIVGSIFKKFQDEHYKKHPQKSREEYQKKLQIYKEQQQKIQAQQNQEKQKQQQEQSQSKKEIKSDFNTYNGGKTEKYSWSQTGADVVVGINLKEHINKKQIKVDITPSNLVLKIKDNIYISGKFYDKVKHEDSTWSIEGDLLTLTLEKANDNIWKTVIQGDIEIDATKVENTKPLEDFDPETQGALRKIMYEQQRKQMGLPTTEEESQLETLKKAWDAEGSPFKGQPFDPSKFNLGGGQMQL